MLVRWICLGVEGALAAAGTCVGALQLPGNFHAVVAGEAYSSTQPTPERIAQYRRSSQMRRVV